MRSKTKIKCDECESSCNSKTLRHFQNKLICFNCWRSKKDVNIIGMGGPMIYLQPVVKRATVFMTLTNEQHTFLFERSNGLGLSRSQYVRELIIADMIITESLIEDTKENSEEEGK